MKFLRGLCARARGAIGPSEMLVDRRRDMEGMLPLCTTSSSVGMRAAFSRSPRQVCFESCFDGNLWNFSLDFILSAFFADEMQSADAFLFLTPRVSSSTRLRLKSFTHTDQTNTWTRASECC